MVSKIQNEIGYQKIDKLNIYILISDVHNYLMISYDKILDIQKVKLELHNELRAFKSRNHQNIYFRAIYVLYTA